MERGYGSGGGWGGNTQEENERTLQLAEKREMEVGLLSLLVNHGMFREVGEIESILSSWEQQRASARVATGEEIGGKMSARRLIFQNWKPICLAVMDVVSILLLLWIFYDDIGASIRAMMF